MIFGGSEHPKTEGFTSNQLGNISDKLDVYVVAIPQPDSALKGIDAGMANLGAPGTLKN